MGLPEPSVIEAHIHEWLNLVVRWIHMITGIAWIGASFYFNWVEGQLNRRGRTHLVLQEIYGQFMRGILPLTEIPGSTRKLPEKLHCSGKLT